MIIMEHLSAHCSWHLVLVSSQFLFHDPNNEICGISWTFDYPLSKFIAKTLSINKIFVLYLLWNKILSNRSFSAMRPPLLAAKNSVSVHCTKNEFQNDIRLYMYLLWNAKLIWTYVSQYVRLFGRTVPSGHKRRRIQFLENFLCHLMTLHIWNSSSLEYFMPSPGRDLVIQIFGYLTYCRVSLPEKICHLRDLAT